MPSPAVSSRRRCCAISSRAPTRSASTTTSSKRSTSRGRPSKAASVRTGACSTPRAQPKFAWTGPIFDPDHWKLAGDRRRCSACCSRCRSWRSPAPPSAQAAARGRRACRRRLGRDRVRLLERPLLRARAPPSRSSSASSCWSRWSLIAMARIEEIAAIVFGRGPRRLLRRARRWRPRATRRKCRSTFRPIWSRRRC